MSYYVERTHEWVDDKDTEVIQSMASYDVKGKSITVNALVRVYKPTEEPVFDMDLDEQLLEQLYRKYDELYPQSGKDDDTDEETRC